MPITREAFVRDEREPSSRVDQQKDVLPVIETRLSRPFVSEDVDLDGSQARRLEHEELAFAARERRGEAFVSKPSQPANRSEQKPLPFHQRVRMYDLERLGIELDV